MGIEGRFYNNPLENRHKGQKKKIEEEVEKSRDLRKIINAIEKWIDENYLQEISLALRGLGKYRLARSFENLFVDATTWLRISPENREVKIKYFQTYNPKPSTSYKKPSNAGKKGTRQVIPVTERSKGTGLVYPVSVVVVVRTEKSKFSMKDNFSFKK